MRPSALFFYGLMETRRLIYRTRIFFIPAFLMGLVFSIMIYSGVSGGTLSFPGGDGLALFFVLAISTGIVSFDSRNGWMRGVMSRPIHRSTVLGVRMLSASIVVFVLLCCCWVSMMIDQGLREGFDVFRNASVGMILLRGLLLYCLVLTYVAINSLLSCFVPGNGNSIVLVCWSLVINLLTIGLRQAVMPPFLKMLANSAFPSGLANALRNLTHVSFSSPDLAWGIFSLFLYVGLALAAMNRMTADREGA